MGFTLNFRNKQILNFQTLLDIVSDLRTPQEINIPNPTQICREKHTRKIVTKPTNKKCRLLFDKRIIQEDQTTTVPYGFYWERPSDTDSGSQGDTYQQYKGKLTPTAMLFSPYPDSATSSETTNNTVMDWDEGSTNEQSSTEWSDEDEYSGGLNHQEMNDSIDLFATSESESSGSEHSSEFVNDDDDQDDNDLSFYRRLINE